MFRCHDPWLHALRAFGAVVVAMQVDRRPKYDLPENTKTGFVRRLASYSAFFSGNDQELTLHYAAAKREVKRWVTAVGPAAVYSQLERMRSGEPFIRVVGEE